MCSWLRELIRQPLQLLPAMRALLAGLADAIDEVTE